MTFKSKISYLGEKISILPWQMAEQMAVEVDVKNVMYGRRTEDGTHRTSFFTWLGSYIGILWNAVSTGPTVCQWGIIES